MKPLTCALVLALVAGLSGCASPAWDGTVDRWGSLREVLREGDDSGKVALGRVCTPFSHGIGALRGLDGEIAVHRGIPLTSRAGSRDGTAALARIRSSIADPTDEAAFLVLTEVYSWADTRAKKQLDETGFQAWLEIELAGTKAADAPVVPVRVEGVVRWRGHVLAGHCPFSTKPMRPGAAPPVPTHGTAASDTVLVGFFSRLPPGEIAHHGSAFHLHAIDLDTGVVAHVDEFTIGVGTRLFLPAIDGLFSSSPE